MTTVTTIESHERPTGPTPQGRGDDPCPPASSGP
jgi:hypothetical protein